MMPARGPQTVAFMLPKSNNRGYIPVYIYIYIYIYIHMYNYLKLRCKYEGSYVTKKVCKLDS